MPSTLTATIRRSQVERAQINVRLEPDLASRIDAKRMELQKEMGRIPSRSEVVRLALEKYLKLERVKSR